MEISELLERAQNLMENQIKTMLNLVGISTDGVDAGNIKEFYNKLQSQGYELRCESVSGSQDQRYSVRKLDKILASFEVRYSCLKIVITPVVLGTTEV